MEILLSVSPGFCLRPFGAWSLVIFKPKSQHAHPCFMPQNTLFRASKKITLGIENYKPKFTHGTKKKPTFSSINPRIQL